MVLYGQDLVNTLRDKCDHAKRRIWIASPFIGGLKDVRKVIGGRWMLPSVQLRILTDTKAGFIREDTFEEFKNNKAEVRSLFSLHSKVYIIDDWCLVTSANLTGTAFTCRFEIGITTTSIEDILSAFNYWWGRANAVVSLPKKNCSSLMDYQDGEKFPKMFNAPAYKTRNQDKYDAACEKYKDFSILYETITGRNKQMVKDGFTLYQEVDYLFNHLFHHSKTYSSKGCTSKRELKQQKREDLIKRSFIEIRDVYDSSSSKWRLQYSKEIRTLLSPKNIDKLSLKDIRRVLDCFHCLEKRAYYKDKFIKYNNRDTVISAWKQLLFTGVITKSKIDEAIKSLRCFGKSSAQELVGWYYPQKYPLMNSNSDCGMRFFGYDV